MMLRALKKISAAVLCLVLLFAATNVYAESSDYEFLFYDETARKITSKKLNDEFIELNESDAKLNKLTNGWYVVTKSCTIGSVPAAPFTGGGVGVAGEVHIIICDGVTLTIQGGLGREEGDNAKSRLFIHGMANGDCNLEIVGMLSDKMMINGVKNYAHGQGVDIYELSVCGCNVVITGAAGVQGKAPLDACGKDGCVAIQNTHLDIYNSTVKVYGGNGGDSGSKRAFEGFNHGGDGAHALCYSDATLCGGTLELYGGNGGKNLIGSGHDGDSGDAVYGSNVYVKNASVCDAKTGESIDLNDIRDYQSVIITMQNLNTAATLGSGMPIIVIAGVSVIVFAIVIGILKKKKA